MQFVFFNLFWAVMCLSAFTSSLPSAVPYLAIAQWAVLGLWMWYGRTEDETIDQLHGGIYLFAIAALLLSKNVTYYILTGPVLLAYLRMEGGYRHGAQSEA